MPTLEQEVSALKTKVSRLFTHLNLEEDPVIIDPGVFPKPTYEGMVISNLTADCYFFNPAFIRNGLWTNFVNKNGIIFMVTSVNGLNDWIYLPSNAPYGSIIYPGDNMFRGSDHKKSGSSYESYYYGSEFGSAWGAMASDRTQTCGEDRNLLWDGLMYKNYIRVRPKPRTIGYCSSINWTNWTGITEILAPDSVDGPLTQFYQMSVIKTHRGFFGLLTTYRIGNTGQDVEQPAPYTGNEHTTDVQLVWSDNGKDNWQRLNSRLNFIDRKPGIMQQYAWWSVINDTAYIYTAESKRRHTDYENAYNRAGNYFFSSRYKILLTDLFKYKV